MKTINLTPSWQTAVRIYCAVLLNPKASPKAHADAEADLMALAKVVDDLNAREGGVARTAGDPELCNHKSQLYVDTYCIKPKGHLTAHQWPKGSRQLQSDLPALLRKQAE